jgi:hypothetical protein
MNNFKLVSIPGENALGELNRLRAERKVTGLYPVLLGGTKDYELVLEGMEEHRDFYTILNESDAIDVVQWFRKKSKDKSELLQDEGEWPDFVPDSTGVVTHLDVLSRKPLPEVKIALFEGAFEWEVFARLGWGGWNACPFAAHHCAVHRYWAMHYGSEVVSVTGAIVQCVVSRPPINRETTMQLAREQSLYCYDIVSQGVGTISALGATLLDAKYWYFWWD